MNAVHGAFSIGKFEVQSYFDIFQSESDMYESDGVLLTYIDDHE